MLFKIMLLNTESTTIMKRLLHVFSVKEMWAFTTKDTALMKDCSNCILCDFENFTQDHGRK